LSESARQPNVRQIGSSNKSFDMEPGAIVAARADTTGMGQYSGLSLAKYLAKLALMAAHKRSGVEKTDMTGTTGRLARGGEKRREAARR
jgi:hypothetical protein